MDMEPLPIERSVTEKMLSGSLHPEDAPPELAPVAALLLAASRPIVASDKTRDDRTVAAMVSAVGTGAAAAGTSSLQAGPERPRRKFLRTKLVGALAAAMLLLGTGLAFAGALPPAMQNTAAHLLGAVGIHVPRSGDGQPSGRDHVKGPHANGRASHGLCTAFAVGQRVHEFCGAAKSGGKPTSVPGQSGSHRRGSPSTNPGAPKGPPSGGGHASSDSPKAHGLGKGGSGSNKDGSGKGPSA